MKSIFFTFILLLQLHLVADAQNQLHVKLSPELKGPYTGRLLVYTLSDTTKQFGGASESEAAFAINVKDWKNNEIKTINARSEYYLKNIDSLKNGYYKVIAILDTNTKERPTSAPGNLYTKAEVILKVEKGTAHEATLTLNTVFGSRAFKETENIKEVVFQSALLSKFRKEPIYIKAAVVLPPSYGKDANQIYPVVYIIPGWTGTHYNAFSAGQRNAYGVSKGEEKIFVFLNPETQTPFGLHGFVDSRVNGPWGEALVKEFMPYMNEKYKTSKNPALNFITGQSTGGYAAVWLALHYPASFGACYATSPDPVDFSNYIGIDLYKDNNYFTDQQGKERGFYMIKGVYQTTLRKTDNFEKLEGNGGQFQSFDAEFGIMGKDGKPQPLYDPKTGKIDPKVVANWKPYDLALFVEKNWSRVKNDAAGKIHIYVGANDNFRLNESAKAFAAKAKKVNAAIFVEEIPGADHFSIRNPEFVDKISADIDARIKKAK